MSQNFDLGFSFYFIKKRVTFGNILKLFFSQEKLILEKKKAFA